ncbi:MAG: ABC transporter ATP-binding protein [Candidatus Bathyarchaeota archaeon]|nr:ABC transporter ATP-binding protein [Candidatus Bathyarchaeota archaeon]
MTALAVDTIELTKTFGELTAVNHLNLQINKGEIFGLLGPNGAGKTTAIRMLCGILAPTSGEANVLGINVNRDPESIRQIIGYMSQGFILYKDLTVHQNLDFFAKLYSVPKSTRDSRIIEMLDLVDLQDFSKMLAGNLSGGMRQRLALAVALVHEPELLILDEPTAGIDPPLRRTFWKFFKQLKNDDITLLVTTHYMDESENCDRVGIISHGKLATVGSPSEIKRSIYGGSVIEVEVLGNPRIDEAEIEHIDVISKILKIEDTDNGFKKVYFIVSDISLSYPVINSFFSGKGLEIRSIREVHVSMEDAFIKFTEGQ